MRKRARVCKTATEAKAICVFSAPDSRAYKLSAPPPPKQTFHRSKYTVMVWADGSVVSKGPAHAAGVVT